MLTRRSLLVAASLLVFGGLAGTSATRAGEAVNTTAENVAILGYDPVAYFTEAEPRLGDPDFEHVWQDARWRFVSAEHRDLFVATF